VQRAPAKGNDDPGSMQAELRALSHKPGGIQVNPERHAANWLP
jgi:hypothetical protein